MYKKDYVVFSPPGYIVLFEMWISYILYMYNIYLCTCFHYTFLRFPSTEMHFFIFQIVSLQLKVKMYLVDRLFIILKGIRKSYTYVTSEQHRFDNFEVFQTIKRLD